MQMHLLSWSFHFSFEGCNSVVLKSLAECSECNPCKKVMFPANSTFIAIKMALWKISQTSIEHFSDFWLPWFISVFNSRYLLWTLRPSKAPGGLPFSICLAPHVFETGVLWVLSDVWLLRSFKRTILVKDPSPWRSPVPFMYAPLSSLLLLDFFQLCF